MLKIKPFKNKNNKHPLKLEYEYLVNEKYYKISIKKEEKINRYLDKCILKNTKTNEMVKIKKDILKEFNETKNLTYLKCKEIDRIRREEELEPVFITLTNPSEYHPFISSKDSKEFIKINSNFNFLNLEDAIDESYENINQIFREFYKNVKKRENKEMKYIKVIEPHSSLIRHLHRIIYINKDTYLKVVKKFNTIVKKFDLKEVKIERLKEIKGSSYIIKYLLKNYKSEEIRKLDGYKKNHKIRIFTMSNLPLSSSNFKKLYYANEELNKEVIEEIKQGTSKYNNLYQFYTMNTDVKKFDVDKNINKINWNKEKRFLLLKITEKKSKKEIIKIKQYKKTFEIYEDKLIQLNYERKENKTFYKIKSKVKDFTNNENICFVDMYYIKEIESDIERKKIIEFKIFDTKKDKEIYNIKNFKVIKMI